MKEFFKSRKLNIICSVSAILLMWAVWIIAYFAVDNEYIIPSFAETFRSFFACLAEGDFWIAFAFTLLRTAESFIISSVLAAVCAILASIIAIFKHIVQPFVTVLRTLPTLAVILVILIWTNAKTAPLIVACLMLFPILYSQITAAIEGVDGEVIKMAKLYGVAARDRIFKIYLPMASPNILSQLGADFSLGLKVIISAEVLSNTYKSLGGLMQSARSFLEMPRLAALTIVAVIVGLIIDVAFSQLKRINRRWYEGAGND